MNKNSSKNALSDKSFLFLLFSSARAFDNKQKKRIKMEKVISVNNKSPFTPPLDPPTQDFIFICSLNTVRAVYTFVEDGKINVAGDCGGKKTIILFIFIKLL